MGSGAVAASVLTRAQRVAALLNPAAPGRISAGGATRLFPAAGGWCALTLSRPDDFAMVPALLAIDAVAEDPWHAVEEWAAGLAAADVAERARLLGLPVAVLGETAAAPPRVSALGPGQLLARAGATVVKVESTARPGGTRAGSPAFFNWMNSGKLSYTVDFDDTADLAALLDVADVVIGASRPAALIRRGLRLRSVKTRPSRVWLRITGHGTEGDCADWVAFGDDAAVSGGLFGYRSGAPVFSGDAIADPLTGLHAATAIVAYAGLVVATVIGGDVLFTR